MPKVSTRSSSRQKTVRLREDLHSKLADQARKEGKDIIVKLEEILVNSFAAEKVDLLDLKIEDVIVARLRKFEDRLAKMWGKQGMDVSMVLMIAASLLSREINKTATPEKQVDIELILKTMRPIAAKHFSVKTTDES